ncbi:MAG: NAD-dependent epimerase/dehydratase family protein [Deltaproteobacteria bacterium]|nr:NAD-dependent epimerase/dehydratase family protein [Deltaproteobacteria bacterium]
MIASVQRRAQPVSKTDLDEVLALAREPLAELRNERIFISGGTGFFGMWLLETLVHANRVLGLGCRIAVLTRRPEEFAARAPHLAGLSEIAPIRGDVRSFDFPSGTFSHVIHAAAELSTRQNANEPGELLDTMVGGTAHVLDLAERSGTSRLLLVSSGAVYGRQPPDLARIPEGWPGGPDPLDPCSAYAEGKRTAELLCAIRSRGKALEVKVARCFAFVGPHLPLDGHFAVGNFIRDGLRGGPIEVRGDGTPRRSYLYPVDLVSWLLNIFARGQRLRPYNVGSPDDVSIAELANLVSRAFPSPPEVVVCGQTVPGSPPERYVPEVSRAADELGLRPTVGLEEGLKRTVSWHSNR